MRFGGMGIWRDSLRWDDESVEAVGANLGRPSSSIGMVGCSSMGLEVEPVLLEEEGFIRETRSAVAGVKASMSISSVSMVIG